MRLINVDDLTLHEFNETNPPPYAILSHTWEDGQEVSYQEMLVPNQETQKKRGYNKIVKCALEAKERNLLWIWCDTCCIDKSSSAELSEAINSMYAYYQRAELCFAFLADVEISSDLELLRRKVYLHTEEGNREMQEAFFKSRWFTRGWTLQELIAPQNLLFFDSSWRPIFYKYVIADQISTFTGIPTKVLRYGNPCTCSVAQRLSWAAKRQTTRMEDMSYCLLGIFDVNIPLLYGEGKKAFVRLQEEIMRNSTDQSIFAWEIPDEINDPLSCVFGILADSPQWFKNCGEITETFDMDDDDEIPTFTMTNLGLHISLPVITFDYGILCAFLSCSKGAKDEQQQTQIYLRKLRKGLYARIPPRALESDQLLYTESFQLVITQRFFSTKLVHFHDAYGAYITSNDYSSKTVFLAPHFQEPHEILKSSPQTLCFQRPIPGPEQDEPWLSIVVGDMDRVVLLLGLRPGTEGDVLWAQCVDNFLPDFFIKRLCDVGVAARSILGEITPEGPLDDLQYDVRYAIPSNFTCCTFKMTQDSNATKWEKKELRLFARPEIQDNTLVLKVHLNCLW